MSSITRFPILPDNSGATGIERIKYGRSIMLIKRQFLDGISEGRVTLAFRRWRRPTVKAGGSLRTIIGMLAIESVDVVAEQEITNGEAIEAGYSSRAELLAELNVRKEGNLYRIALRFSGADPRHELRERDELSDAEIDELKNLLARMDARSKSGPWTTMTLGLIATHPGKRATELADSAGMDTKRFKGNVRKLKELGLTESLKVGYRLSPRGAVVVERLES